jgi:hypothetical protein
MQKFVMPGLVPGIHVFTLLMQENVDGRDKPGHDEERFIFQAVSLKCWKFSRRDSHG